MVLSLECRTERLARLLTPSVVLDKSFHLSVLQFPVL